MDQIGMGLIKYIGRKHDYAHIIYPGKGACLEKQDLIDRESLEHVRLYVLEN